LLHKTLQGLTKKLRVDKAAQNQNQPADFGDNQPIHKPGRNKISLGKNIFRAIQKTFFHISNHRESEIRQRRGDNQNLPEFAERAEFNQFGNHKGSETVKERRSMRDVNIDRRSMFRRTHNFRVFLDARQHTIEQE
jgi:hypothetical protein